MALGGLCRILSLWYACGPVALKLSQRDRCCTHPYLIWHALWSETTSGCLFYIFPHVNTGDISDYIQTAWSQTSFLQINFPAHSRDFRISCAQEIHLANSPSISQQSSSLQSTLFSLHKGKQISNSFIPTSHILHGCKEHFFSSVQRTEIIR